MAAVGRLSAGVAHEIRNPLSSIRGLAQYLGSKMEEGSDEAGYAKVMIQEADRLNRVVSDLLAYARPRPLDRTETDLNEIASRVAELVREQAAGKGVELSLELDPDLEPQSLDPDQMTQVILNLVLNGIESGAGRVYSLHLGRTRGGPILRVADDGPGVGGDGTGRDLRALCDHQGRGLRAGLGHQPADRGGARGQPGAELLPGRGGVRDEVAPRERAERPGEA